MRGKCSVASSMRSCKRNIPAYAGKIVGSEEERGWCWEHPRVCGENRKASGAVIAGCGTSPRMRGKCFKQCFRIIEKRNIPAYAGKIKCRSCRRTRRREHPRVCGENASSTCMISMMVGTSPRMRGKSALSKLLPTINRNIPAYAGKITRRAKSSLTPWEHPRVCGENLFGYHTCFAQCGTSPRTRGKPGMMVHRGGLMRNIPAYAGKTTAPMKSWPKPGEHPRVRGENSPLGTVGVDCDGTSPRTRGKPQRP